MRLTFDAPMDWNPVNIVLSWPDRKVDAPSVKRHPEPATSRSITITAPDAFVVSFAISATPPSVSLNSTPPPPPAPPPTSTKLPNPQSYPHSPICKICFPIRFTTSPSKDTTDWYENFQRLINRLDP